MSDLTPLAPRLGTPLGKLGGDHGPEVLLAVRQLLEAAGLAFNDLGRLLEAPAELADDGPVLRPWRIAVQWIVDHPDWRPSDREFEFVTAMRQFLKRKAPIERQAKWLRDIVERPGGVIDES